MIDVRIDAYSATLTIDRQEKANSLTEAMLRDLTGHLDDLAGRDDIRAAQRGGEQ